MEGEGRDFKICTRRYTLNTTSGRHRNRHICIGVFVMPSTPTKLSGAGKSYRLTLMRAAHANWLCVVFREGEKGDCLLLVRTCRPRSTRRILKQETTHILLFLLTVHAVVVSEKGQSVIKYSQFFTLCFTLKRGSHMRNMSILIVV